MVREHAGRSCRQACARSSMSNVPIDERYEFEPSLTTTMAYYISQKYSTYRYCYTTIVDDCRRRTFHLTSPAFHTTTLYFAFSLPYHSRHCALNSIKQNLPSYVPSLDLEISYGRRIPGHRRKI
jgi:hypothetical protein